MPALVFDTNVLLSAAMLPKSTPAQAVGIALRASNRFMLVLSEATWAEFLDVLYRPKLDKYLNPARRAEFVRLIEASADWVEIHTAVVDCRDPRDNKFLDVALATQATCVVTGDADLLVLTPWRGTAVLTPAQFISAYQH